MIHSRQGLGAPDGRLRTQVFDEAFRKTYPHVMRWWLTLAHQPAFAAVLGDVKLCEQPMKFTPPKKEAGAKADGAAKEAAPKKEKEPKKEAAPKKVPRTRRTLAVQVERECISKKAYCIPSSDACGLFLCKCERVCQT